MQSLVPLQLFTCSCPSRNGIGHFVVKKQQLNQKRMFKKFTAEDVSGQTQVKSSVQRGIKAKILEQFPTMEGDVLDSLLPKKASMYITKCLDRVTIVTIDGKYLFFNHFDGPYFPNLKILHTYPDILPKIQVDKGAIKFVLKGADIMCPGMTSSGARLPEVNLPKDTVIAIYAEGKEHALAVGLTSMSTDEIKSINKGIGVRNIHVLGDGLWDVLK